MIARRAAIVGLVLVAGCSRAAAPTGAPAAVSAPAAAEVAGPAAPAASDVASDTPSGDGASVSGRDAAAPASGPDAALPVEAVADGGSAADPGEGPALAGGPLAAPPTCEEACRHILAVTLAELPPSTGEDVRGPLREAMGAPCVVRCDRDATPDSLRCVMASESALALSACGQ